MNHHAARVVSPLNVLLALCTVCAGAFVFTRGAFTLEPRTATTMTKETPQTTPRNPDSSPGNQIAWRTSFLPSENWTADVVQAGAGCGTGFANIQPGLGDNGHWRVQGTCDAVTTDANNPTGRGGRGFRHWRGDGQNVTGGGLTVTLPQATTELYVAVAIRFQAGLRWANGAPLYTKELYFDPYPCGRGCVVLGYQGGAWGLNYDNDINMPSILTWSASQNGPAGDGRFHCYEWHVRKADAKSLSEFRFDGRLQRIALANTNLGRAPMQRFMLGENQHNQNNGGPRYVDYDDIAVSLAGWTGCPAT